MTASPPGSAPTPPQEEQPNGAYASYVPHDLKYSADFEDALMRAILNANAKQDGIRVIPNDSDEQPRDGISVRASDVSLQSLPSISEGELPLSLDDSRRVFASPVAGVKLTHPTGYLEGGPGLDPQMDTFPDDFLQHHPHITTANQLREDVQEEVETTVGLLRDRMENRQKAKERNEQIEKELKVLMDQHGVELRMHNRIAEEQERKRQAKEKRRKEREGSGNG